MARNSKSNKAKEARRKTESEIDEEIARETIYQAACDAIRDNTYTSISAASRAFGIDYQTLRSRYHGFHGPARAAHEGQQYLSNSVEEVLADWSTFLSLTGHGWTRKTIAYKVELLCQKVPRNRWFDGFLKRHQDTLRFSKPAGLDPKRAQAFNRPVVGQHFTLLDHMIKELQAKMKNVYNMDEKGLQIGGGRKGLNCKVLFSREDRARYRIQNADLELVTVIECVSAAGAALKPGFVFHGKSTNFDMAWLEVDDDISVGISPNGWTDDFVGARWFEESFIPQARANTDVPGENIILTYDGHGSHTSTELVNIAFKTPDIHLYCLPPKTTHKLQPLDVGVFGPTQRAWSDRCAQVISATGVGIPRSDIVKEYMLARGMAFTVDIISQAWRRAGINPFNPNIFTDADFAPSLTTSTSVHFPSSWPTGTIEPASFLEDPDLALESIPVPGRFDALAGVEDATLIARGWERYRNRIIETNDNYPSQTLTVIVETIQEARTREAAADAANAGVLEASESSESASSHGNSPAPAPHSIARRSCRIASAAVMPAPNPRAPIEVKLTAMVHQHRLDQEENKRLHNALERANAHIALAGAEAAILRTRQISQTKKTPKRTVNARARWITSAEGRAEFEIQETEQRVKDAREAEKLARKEGKRREDDERHRQIVLAGDSYQFEGSLWKKNKPDLQELATALHIPHGESTKVDEFRKLISNYLSTNEASLRGTTRFSGLYTTGRGRRALPQVPVQDRAMSVTPDPASRASTPSTPSHIPVYMPVAVDHFGYPIHSPSAAAIVSQPNVAGPSRYTLDHPTHYHPYSHYIPPPSYAYNANALQPYPTLFTLDPDAGSAAVARPHYPLADS